jgi:hypothetical protein
MTATALKNLAIVTALLAGGTSLALIGFLAAPQIVARQASGPESAPIAQRSTPADQLVSEIGQAGAPVAPVREAQPSAPTSTSAAQTGSSAHKISGAAFPQEWSSLSATGMSALSHKRQSPYQSLSCPWCPSAFLTHRHFRSGYCAVSGRVRFTFTEQCMPEAGTDSDKGFTASMQ